MPAALAAAPIAGLAGAIVVGWFCVRLSGVYLAMLTLAFAQIAWSIAFQWDSVTGGSNGLVGIWPPDWLAQGRPYYWFVLGLGSLALAALAWIAQAPFGYALRACRDSPLRAQAIGIDVQGTQRMAFALAGAFAGLAGGLYAFSKGSISPETLAIPRSVDALVMVLLGGLNALAGPMHRRRRVHLAVGHAVAHHRILARGARSGDPGDRPRVSDGHRRCAVAAHRAVARMTTVLRVDGLRKDFGGVHAVRDVSFTVDAGELVALIGPNGAGKTTCFNLVNGQLAPDAGTVRLGDARIDGLPPRRIARMGVGRTFQVAATFASMTVRENVQLALLAHAGRDHGVAARATLALRGEADALLERVRMTRFADQGCATLAYGDAKRVELALALAAHPRLLLMDEPTAGMSPQFAQSADDARRRSRARGEDRRALHRARHGRRVRPCGPCHRPRSRTDHRSRRA